MAAAVVWDKCRLIWFPITSIQLAVGMSLLGQFFFLFLLSATAIESKTVFAAPRMIAPEDNE